MARQEVRKVTAQTNRHGSRLLADRMKADRRDWSLQEMYEVACRPPHRQDLNNKALHNRLSRHVAQARHYLGPEGLLLVWGERRFTYRVVENKKFG